MDDLISRQAAIDALTHEWNGMVTSVFDVIKSLPSAQPEQRWIPVTERLPEHADNVIICYKDAYTRNTDAFFEGYLTWEDVIETLDKKCDMKIELSDDLEARR